LWHSNSWLSFWWYIILHLLTGATEEYNGTSWTTVPNALNTARYALAGAGIQTAALAFGGHTGTSLYRMQQKNMMEQVGQPLLEV
jgi:hypothetical protein